MLAYLLSSPINKRQRRRFEKPLANPKAVSPEELGSALEACGFDLKRQSGSHMTYFRRGSGIITVPYRRPHVKKHYVEHVLDKMTEIAREEEE